MIKYKKKTNGGNKMENTTTIVREIPSLEGLFTKLKNQMMNTLGYTEDVANDQAEKFSTMFKNAFSE